MRKYLIVFEKSKDGFGAYSPDLPGCVALASSKEKVEEKMYEAINFHLEGLKEDGLSIPKGESSAEYIILPTAV